MKTNRLRLRVALVAVMAYLAMFMMVPAAQAGIIGTQTQLNQESHAAKVAKVRELLSQQRVEKQMVRLGVDPAAAQARVASLTDQQLNTIQGKLGSLPAGAGVVWIVGVVFIVLIILDLIGIIHIF